MEKKLLMLIIILLSLFLYPNHVLASSHPQILFGTNDISLLQQKAASPDGVTIWGSMSGWINRHFNDPHPAIPVDRYSARLISKSGMAYLITGDVKYAQKTRDWIMYFVNDVSDWQGGYGNGGTSYLVHDISLGYDWIQSWWATQPGGEAEIQLLRNKLVAVVPTIDLPISQGGCGNRHRSYVAIGLAGYALQGEVPEADGWILKAKNWFSKYMSPTLGYGSDGFWTDGPDYAAGEQSEIVGVLFAAAKYHNDNFWDTQWGRNQKNYWSYMWTGATKTYDFFPKGDTFSYAAIIKEVTTDYNAGMRNIGYYKGGGGPAMLFFSNFYQDPVLKYIAQQQIQADDGRYYWDPSVIWAIDPNLTSQPPTGNYSLSHYFPDFEAVVAKSGWTENDTQFYLKAGVVNGKVGFQNSMRTDSYEAHSQEDANGMMIFSRGEYMVIKDAYTEPRFNHTISTILVDGGGQWHDGDMWGVNPIGHPNVEKQGLRSVVDTDTIFYTIGDAAYGFLPTKLNKFDRNVAFFRPDIFVVFDEVGHTNTHRYDWNLQMEYDKTIQNLGENKFREIGSRSADMNLTFIKPPVGQLSVEQGTHNVTICTNISPTSPCGDQGPVFAAPYISFYPTVNTNQTQFLAVLQTKNKGGPDINVNQISAVGGTAVQVGSNNYCLSADIGAAEVTLGAVRTAGRFLCWQGDQNNATSFVAGPAQQIEISPYKITSSNSGFSIGLNQLKGQYDAPAETAITLDYPNVDSILIDGSQISPLRQGLNSITFTAPSGIHAIELTLVTNTTTPPMTPTPKPGDANGDDVVDGIDYTIWLNHYSQHMDGGVSVGDFNGDGVVDGVDYVIWLNAYTR